jgi:PilZ domain-containing protein
MNTNRRQARTVPEKLAFIQLDQGDGGRVLNLSEEGLGFEVFAPLHRNGPIRFWFTLDLSDRIEAVGEVAWTNTSGRVGGIRFLELSRDALGQIRNWIRQNSKHNTFIEGSPDSKALTTPALPDGTQLVPLERYLSANRRQLIRGVFLGILVTSAVAIPAAKYSNSRKQIGAPAPTAGQATVVNSELQGRPAAPVSVSDAARNSAGSAPGKTQGSASVNPLVDNPLGSRLVKQRPQTHSPSPEGSSMNSVAQSASSETRRTIKKAASPQQLWSAVQAGNSQAAFTLADLYLHGDGVPANCDQARVLLLVASEKGNAQAIKELRELDKTGCPAPAQ